MKIDLTPAPLSVNGEGAAKRGRGYFQSNDNRDTLRPSTTYLMVDQRWLLKPLNPRLPGEFEAAPITVIEFFDVNLSP